MKDGKYVVLCVDDDVDLLDSMRIILEDADFVVETAPTAMAGFSAYQDTQPDLMIVDLMMEEVDAGTSLVKDIRARSGKLPIFMLSSVGDSLHRNVSYADLGLSGLLQKPVDPRALVQALRAKLPTDAAK